jgi:hypothetical protein
MSDERITITLNPKESQALVSAAVSDMRHVKLEARYLLRQELVRRGLLSSEENKQAGEVRNDPK